MEKEYGPEIDVWSIGCIFAELLSKINGNSYPSSGQIDSKSRVLFPGNSCYPLSPKEEVNNLDQLAAILMIIGTPSKSDKEFISDWTA